PLAPRRGERVGVRGAATRSAPFHWRFVVLRDPLTPTLCPVPGARGEGCRGLASAPKSHMRSPCLDGGGPGWGWATALHPETWPIAPRGRRGGPLPSADRSSD